jgi:hypothetical protein
MTTPFEDALARAVVSWGAIAYLVWSWGTIAYLACWGWCARRERDEALRALQLLSISLDPRDPREYMLSREEAEALEEAERRADEVLAKHRERT